MKHLFSRYTFIALACCWQGCKQLPSTTVTIDSSKVINSGYIGNGAQWDPYQLEYGKGRVEISEADWKKLYERLDYMRPQFMRVMINTASSVHNGKLELEPSVQDLIPILGYCQSRNVTVIFGDWGGRMVDAKQQTISEQHLDCAVQYVDHLINNKGFTCVKYYNMVNEPNGFWSSIDGSYPLWSAAIKYLDQGMKKASLSDRLTIVGPDAAVWTGRETWWVDSCAHQLGNIFCLLGGKKVIPASSRV